MAKEATKTKDVKTTKELSNITLDQKEFPEPQLEVCLGMFEAEPQGSKKLTVRKKKYLNPIPLFVLKDILLSVTSVELVMTKGYLPTAAVHTDVILFGSLYFTIAAVFIAADLLCKHLAER